jgi:hypothetical protein
VTTEEVVQRAEAYKHSLRTPKKHVPTHEDVMAALAIVHLSIEHADLEQIKKHVADLGRIYEGWYATLDLGEEEPAP